ncbi:IclR family transcriptional regulator C-terminal domain-containing protein [Peribacillus frigoritolerans]|uniref:IclR family transcriptional regulator n=1 Tax=Peribacillus frigoritolerans TaxID=450367 RepID=UPI002E248DE9|nr:IclR family transcriptional regulator C-terminal domain-containing protein [Peribacillus frigoritolerans]
MSESLNISPPSTHRLLTTLKMDGLVFQDADSKKYSLGTVFIDYANKIITDVPFVSIIDPQLIKLRDETQETVGFYMLTNMVRMCVIEHVSNQEKSRKAGVGNNSATARLKRTGNIGISKRRVTGTSIKPPSRGRRKMLQQQLEIIVNTRYSINEEEITKNVAALSAPVFGAKGKVIGAISISGPFFRWHEESMEQHISLLLKTAESISNSLY